jgi:hypothetical protein
MIPLTTAIRDALAVNLRSVDGLNVQARYSGQVTPPAAIILRGITRPGLDHGDAIDFEFRVTLVVQFASVGDSVSKLDELIDRGEVIEALEGDQSLGGIVGGVQVNEIGPEGVATFDGVDYATCDIAVQVVL